MKLINSSFLVAIAAFLLAFKAPTGNEVTGTYGVGKGDPVITELKINRDGTFTYVDCKKISVRGVWELKKNTILLKNHGSRFSFHDKWKVERDGKAVRSRNGLNFYRLVKIAEAN